MNKLQQKIKSLLREIKEQQENRYWYVATITFSTDTFYRRVNDNIDRILNIDPLDDDKINNALINELAL